MTHVRCYLHIGCVFYVIRVIFLVDEICVLFVLCVSDMCRSGVSLSCPTCVSVRHTRPVDVHRLQSVLLPGVLEVCSLPAVPERGPTSYVPHAGLRALA